MLARSTEWIASNKATASFALFDCNGPIKCNSMPGVAAMMPGHLALASCTRFSPKRRCPTAKTGAIASAPKVFETAISCTELRARPASLQARAISSSTAARPDGEWVINSVLVMPATLRVHDRFKFYRMHKTLFEGCSLWWSAGKGIFDVIFQFPALPAKTQDNFRRTGAPRAGGVGP